MPAETPDRDDELQSSLQRIKEEPAPVEGTDQSSLEREHLENQKRAEEVEQLRQDRVQRRTFAPRIFRLIWLWLIAVLLILLLEGFGLLGFGLSGSVLIALITSTTASVIAIFIVVAKYLFPQQ